MEASDSIVRSCLMVINEDMVQTPVTGQCATIFSYPWWF